MMFVIASNKHNNMQRNIMMLIIVCWNLLWAIGYGFVF